MILATAHALPHDIARQSFAVGMVHESFYRRIALPWPAVEQFIMRHTEALPALVSRRTRNRSPS